MGLNDAPAHVRKTVDRVAEAMFGQPIVTNVFRSLLAEAIVADALGSDWMWCSADFALWDFEHTSKLRLEVKQSAARQTWWEHGRPPSRAVFDIAHREKVWIDGRWVSERARHAQLYVFAHHPVTDETVDHRDATQWRFYLARTDKLPETRSITLAGLTSIASVHTVDDLGEAVGKLIGEMAEAKNR